MNFKPTILGLIILTLISNTTKAQLATNEVKIVGEMKNVMWKGQLNGNISLDTIADKTNLYGLGPIEYLAGEILMSNGQSYISKVASDSTMTIEETFNIKAPFFAYANISKWTEQTITENIKSIQQLETYLDHLTKKSQRPFMFKITGVIDQATIHIVNLPKGSKVNSPDEAHKGQKNYEIHHEQAEIIGFFSTEHKAIFTHHDTFLHMHLMTSNKQKMGHLDKVSFNDGTLKLYLPNG